MALLNSASLAFRAIGNQQSARTRSQGAFGSRRYAPVYRYCWLFCDTTGKQVIRLLIADCYLLSRARDLLKGTAIFRECFPAIFKGSRMEILFPNSRKPRGGFFHVEKGWQIAKKRQIDKGNETREMPGKIRNVRGTSCSLADVLMIKLSNVKVGIINRLGETASPNFIPLQNIDYFPVSSLNSSIPRYACKDIKV